MPLLSDSFVQAIEADYAALWLSNADAGGQPDVVRLLAVRVEPDREHLTALVPLPQGQGVLDNLAVTPRLSFLFALILGNRSYQIKGAYVSYHPCTEAEVAFGRDSLTRFSQVLVGQGFSPEKAFAAYFSPSGVALTMRIEEIYEQTPRPGTGGKVTFTTPCV
ncbi:MAG TPA: hypothetical protein VF646_06675 [Cytophagales bacterium]|jgi:hypothetical protein